MPKSGFEKRVEDFAEEVEEFIEEFVYRVGAMAEETWAEIEYHTGRHAVQHPRSPKPRRQQRPTKAVMPLGTPSGPFGLIEPFISSMIGIIIFSLVIWMMGFLGDQIGSLLLTDIQIFLRDKMGLFFIMFIFSSYNTYFSRKYHAAYAPLSPIATAVGVTFGLWVVANTIKIANHYIGMGAFSTIAVLVEGNLYPIFGMVLLVGYFALLANIHYPPDKATKNSK